MILDVEKNHLMDSILSVIATTYMDSCSLSTHAFSNDSPSSKLLYAKELQDYKPAVKKFYNDIQVQIILIHREGIIVIFYSFYS